jgi:flagellar biosynthesis GTPase FlhF
MEIKTYRAESVHAALQMIRQDLGSEAVVLRTREVRDGMLALLSGRRCWELTASIDVPVLGPWLQLAGPLDRGIDLSELD